MKIQFYSDIVNEQERLWLEWDGNLDAVSFNSVQKALSTKADDDTKIELVFNCKGGDVIEGWAIYDLLRQQTGCEIFATIEGECSSMASIILLAAPKENRKAYANAHLCIHNPAVCWFDTDYYERLTADNVRKTAEKILTQADSLQTEQNKILATYVERTGCDAETLQALMDKDTYVDMSKAMELGFISSVLAPTTAHKDSRFRAYANKFNQSKEMNKATAKVTAFNKVVAALKEMVGIESSAQMVALEVTDVDGNVLTVEREDGDPQVGDAATPDGTFVLEDGTTITVEGGVISAITPAEAVAPETPAEGEDEPAPAEAEGEGEPAPSVEELQGEIARLNETIATLEQQIRELTEQQPSAEDVAILRMVSRAGGREVVAKALGARSTFNASNTKRIDRVVVAKSEDEVMRENYISAQRETFNKLREKIRN